MDYHWLQTVISPSPSWSLSNALRASLYLSTVIESTLFFTVATCQAQSVISRPLISKRHLFTSHPASKLSRSPHYQRHALLNEASCMISRNAESLHLGGDNSIFMKHSVFNKFLQAKPPYILREIKLLLLLPTRQSRLTHPSRASTNRSPSLATAHYACVRQICSRPSISSTSWRALRRSRVSTSLAHLI